MTERNAGQLEQEAEQIRAGIAQTSEALQDRMSPGRMVDDVMTYMKESDGALAFDNLRRQARDNPMALAVIGAGLAWLVMGNGANRADHDRPYRYSSSAGGPQLRSSGGPDGRSAAGREGGGIAGATSAIGDFASGVADKAQGLGDRARDAAHQATDRVRDAADTAADKARQFGDGASGRGHAAADDAWEMAEHGRRTVMDTFDREPLVLGAIGVAVGAALGAMLPSTRFEDETFGKTRDSLMGDAHKMVDRATETARTVGSEALGAATSALKDEGLVVEGAAVTERVGNVAKAAASAGKDAAEREMGTSAEASTSPTTGDEPPHRPHRGA